MLPLAVVLALSTSYHEASAAAVNLGPCQFFVNGVTNANHIVESSFNLAGWSALRTNRGPFTFTDAGSVNSAARYYRVVSTP